jgi:adenylate kinase
MQGQTYVFFGVQGSGKGTQVTILMDLLKSQHGIECVYASPGGEFRALTASGSYTGNIVKESLDRGVLQPDFLSNTIFANIIMYGLTAEKCIIADGYPRTIVQAENFKQIMKFYGRSNIKLIHIKLSREEALKRNFLRGRADDTEEGLNRRLEWHEKNVVPAMDNLKAEAGYDFFEINGEQSVEAVHADIIKALNL